MASSLTNEIKTNLIALVRDNFNLELDDVVSEIPPKTELGDLAFPLAFDLAKRIKASTGEKKNPREIATRLADGLKTVAGVARIEIAGPGYLNIFFDRAQTFTFLVKSDPTPDSQLPTPNSKLIVEHTSINPNKAAHIGHVRNSVLGDTTARILKATGETVEIHNYIDNTGVQVADVVVGFMRLENKSLDEIKAIAERTVTKREDSFDYYCWDLYSRVGQWYEEDKTRLAIRAQTLHEIEEGNNATAEIGEYISSKIVDCHLATMARLDISYDLLARESEILHLHFWAHAFEKLKASGAIVFETEGRNKGCWVMRAEEGRGDGGMGGQGEIPNPKSQISNSESEHDADKIIVRSNGTVTYTGKDIAYHLWKLGKLGLDFHYRLLCHDHHGCEVWITTGDDSQAVANHPPFGNGTAFLNVIDVGQSYPQANVKKGVMMIDHDERVARSAHLAYEKVTLTPAAAAELGMELSEADQQRQQIGMSGRKGLGVKADDLIDRLETKALAEVQSRNADLSEAQQQKIAHQIAVAALRYFLLKYTRTSIIAFDFEEALKFRGETGPYLQYSVRRLNNIFTELGRSADEVRKDFTQLSADNVAAQFSSEAGDVLWSLVYFASRLEEIVELSANTFEPTHVAKYAFQLADQFNTLYQDKRFHILKESDAKRKTVLLVAVDVVRQKLAQALSLLGIEVPEKM
ncbi:MAG: arginine--tRNA ligase [Acidobacteria bacterium]|nr:arginine--tRNA ligase [Acidobacteriota bacterium]